MLKSFCVALLITVLGVCIFLIYQANNAAEEARAELKLAQSTVAKLERENEEIAARLAAEIERARKRRGSGLESDPETLAAGTGASSRIEGSGDSAVGASPNATREDQLGEEPASTGSEATSAEIPEELKEAVAAMESEKAKSRQERQHQWRVDRIRERVSKVTQRLNLQGEQEESLVAALADNWEKRERILAQVRDSELEAADARPLLDARRAAIESEIKSILSASQYEEFKKAQAEEPGLEVLISGDGRLGGKSRRAAKQSSDTGEPQPHTDSPDSPHE